MIYFGRGLSYIASDSDRIYAAFYIFIVKMSEIPSYEVRIVLSMEALEMENQLLFQQSMGCIYLACSDTGK